MRIFFLFHLLFLFLFGVYHFYNWRFSYIYLFYPDANYTKLNVEKREIDHFLPIEKKIEYSLLALLNGPRNPFFETFFFRKVRILDQLIYLDKLIIYFDEKFFLTFKDHLLTRRYLLLKSILFSLFVSFNQIKQIHIYAKKNNMDIPLTRFPFRRKAFFKENPKFYTTFF